MFLKKKKPKNVIVHPQVVESTFEVLPVTVSIKNGVPKLLIIVGIVILAVVTVVSFTSWAQVVGNIIGALSLILGFALLMRSRA